VLTQMLSEPVRENSLFVPGFGAIASVLDEILSDTEDVIWIAAADLANMLYVSPAATVLFQQSRNELFENPGGIFQRVHPDDSGRIPFFIAELNASGRAETILRIVRPWGEPARIRFRANALRDAAGKLTLVRGVCREIASLESVDPPGFDDKLPQFKNFADALPIGIAVAQPDGTRLAAEIAARENIEPEFLKARAVAEAVNRAKHTFLANISHEIRTPMHGILSFSRFGMEKFESAPRAKLRHYFQRINGCGERLMHIMNDLLDLCTLEAGKMEYSFKSRNLIPILEAVISKFTSAIKEKNQVLEIIEPAVSTNAIFDRVRISQVFGNLLSNAITYSAVNTTITLSFSDGSLDQDSSALCVMLSDQGVGIPEGEYESIFDAFIQSSKTATGAGGTGLGLTICRKIITAHGGRIWAEPNPAGPGSRFVFLLPRRGQP